MSDKETWILFHAESDQPGWETRKLPMGGLTDLLDEQWDYTSSGSIPQVGDRLRQFHRVEEFIDPQFPESSTHVREGDWIVNRVEHYPASSPDCSKQAIVVCYCKFEPVRSELEPLGRTQPAQQLQETTS